MSSTTSTTPPSHPCKAQTVKISPIRRTRAPSGCSPFKTAVLASRSLTHAEVEFTAEEVKVIREAADLLDMTVQEFIRTASARHRRIEKLLQGPAAPKLEIVTEAAPTIFCCGRE